MISLNNKVFLLMLFLFSISYGQEGTEELYFSDKKAKRQTVRDNAKYVLVRESEAEGTIIETMKRIKNDELVWSKIIEVSGDKQWVTTYDSKGKRINELIYGQFIPEGFMQVDHFSEGIISTQTPKVDKRRLETVNKMLQLHVRQHFKYPSEAVRKKLTGKVWVQFTIDTTGKVNHISILQKGTRTLDKGAYEIMTKLEQVLPLTMDGKPIDSWGKIPITFKIASFGSGPNFIGMKKSNPN